MLDEDDDVLVSYVLFGERMDESRKRDRRSIPVLAIRIVGYLRWTRVIEFRCKK
ncbi:hypothetical protein Plhal710r2_c008g0035381 [Plasmopara halstedii]